MELILQTGKKFLLLICVFLYVYSIQFKGVPVSCNILLGLIGICIGIVHLLGGNKQDIKLIIDRSTAFILLSMLIVMCVVLFSTVLNSSTDMVLVKSIILNLFTFLGAYTISLFTKNIYQEVRFDILAKYLIWAAVIQMILSLWLFFVPNVTVILNKILAFSDLESETMDRLEGFRLLGFGTTFFTSGIVHSFVLIIIVILLHARKNKFRETFGYTFAFVLIASVGMMLARTTMVGLMLALALSLYKARFWGLIVSKKLNDIFKSAFLVTAIITIILVSLPPDMLDDLTVVYNFGFEVIENYLTSGEIKTGSTDIMFTMYIFPDNWKTWLIGDGLFANPLNPEFSYYMGTDIGFIRLLFYIGGLGVIVFYFYQLVVIYQVYLKNKFLGIIPFMFIYILFIALNLKGFSDLFFLIVLFYFCSNVNETVSRKIEKK